MKEVTVTQVIECEQKSVKRMGFRSYTHKFAWLIIKIILRSCCCCYYYGFRYFLLSISFYLVFVLCVTTFIQTVTSHRCESNYFYNLLDFFVLTLFTSRLVIIIKKKREKNIK